MKKPISKLKNTQANVNLLADNYEFGCPKCFILGGGPSLKDFDFSTIENYLTIGINKSFIKFPTTVNYAMDYGFYTHLRYPRNKEERETAKAWALYNGVKVFVRQSLHHKFERSIFVVNAIDSIHDLGIPSSREISTDLTYGILKGNNSGFGAIMLAIAMGCRQIGLLGYDLKVDKGKTHWHNGYTKISKYFGEHLLEYIDVFNQYAPKIKELGVEVFNLNPDSSLTCFPKISLEKFQSLPLPPEEKEPDCMEDWDYEKYPLVDLSPLENPPVPQNRVRGIKRLENIKYG